MECTNCNKACQKWGRQKNGTQRFYCTICKKAMQEGYQYQAYNKNNMLITSLLKNSSGIRGIGRVLNIATTTVISRIRKIASSIPKPPIPMNRNCFELDELRTFVSCKKNETWVAYALCPITKEVVDFTVGKRSKKTLRTATGNLLLSEVKAIKTDKLNIYRSLIPRKKHIVHNRCTNHIERHNLNLRTHLKRLSRRTICFSRSKQMLGACLKIYFWG